MPTPDEELAIAEKKFRQFLTLAGEVLIVRQSVRQLLEAAMREGMFGLLPVSKTPS